MKSLFLFISLAFLSLSCEQKTVFEKIDCHKDSTNFDYWGVYRPCRQFIFQAKYWDNEYNLISDEKIWMMATGNTWEFQDTQKEIAIQYDYDEGIIDSIKSYNINKSRLDWPWGKSTTTGFIETTRKVWFHPFRRNQYLFTEVAPFPEVQLNYLTPGARWSGALEIYEGWGDWSDSRIEQHYEVVDTISVNLNFGKINTWRHGSWAEAPFGNSTFDYWYSLDYGFVKMVYKNYAGQILQIELIEVIED